MPRPPQRRRSIRRTWTSAGMVVTGVALLITSCAAGSSDTAADDDVIVIGANLELTGTQASIGQPFERSLKLAEDLLNESGVEIGGKTYTVEIRIEDNRSEPQQGVVIQQQFRQDDVRFILGPAASTVFVPALSAMTGYDHIGLTPAAGAIPLLGTDEGEHLFLTHIPEEGTDGRDAQIVRLLDKRYAPERVAILMAQDPNGELFHSAFTEAFADTDAEIVYSEFFPEDTRDFTSYITGVEKANPDMVVFGYLNTRVTPFLQQAATAGLDPVIVSAPGGDAGALEGVENDISDYVWSVATRSLDKNDDEAIAAYRAAYEKKFGEPPTGADFWGLTYYDPLLMLVKAMQQAGSVDDVDAIAAELSEVEEWDHAAMPDRRFNGETHFAEYIPQIGVFSEGEISYVNAE